MVFNSASWGTFYHIYLKENYIYPPHFDGSYSVNFKMKIYNPLNLIFNQLSVICWHFRGLITITKGIRITKYTERVKLHLIPLLQLENHIGSILIAINI